MSMRSLWAALLLLVSGTVRAGSEDFIWGLGTHVGHGAYSAEDAAKALRRLSIQSFRDDVSWGLLERVSKRYEFSKGEFSQLDRLTAFEDMAGRGLLILGYGNDLYGGGQPGDPAYRSAYADYAGAVARRLGQRVYGFEIWNEWNIGAGNRQPHSRQGSASGYVELVKAAAPKIRGSAPGAKIVCAALADKDLKWVEKIVEMGVLTHCDALSMHPYNFSEGQRAKPHYVATWLDELDRRLRQITGKSFPILVTELGWPNHYGTHGFAEEAASGYWLQSALYLLARPYVQGLWWYELRDSGASRSEREHNFGVVRDDWSDKPIAAVMRVMMPLLTKVDRKTIQISETDEIVRWQATLVDGRKISAYWTAGGEKKEYRVGLSPSIAYFGYNQREARGMAGYFDLSGLPIVFLQR